jgi:hypothetical protein
VRAHLFEFRSDKKKLKCVCGWERGLKTTDIEAAYAKFREHTLETARKAAQN